MTSNVWLKLEKKQARRQRFNIYMEIVNDCLHCSHSKKPIYLTKLSKLHSVWHEACQG